MNMPMQYNPNGEIASYHAEDNAPVYDFDRGWGNRLDADKDSLNGQNVTVVGIEQGEDFGMGMTVFLLVKFDGEPENLEPWGIMFSENSAVVKQARSMANRGSFPFRASLQKVASTQHKGQSYWKFDRPINPALEAPTETPKVKH